MVRRSALPIFLAVSIAFLTINCSKDSTPTQPAPTPSVPHLTAIPPSVTLAAGATGNVAISGGTPPYSISSPPGASATALLLFPDSLVATLQITGVTVASVSTAVTVRDNSTALKSTTVPIAVH